MERENDIHDELKDIAPGFPAKQAIDPPEGYFETFPDQVLNRWNKEESHPAWSLKIWKRVIGIAALLTGLCIGGWFLFINQSTQTTNYITATEAYQYVNENIDEFEPLIEVGDIPLDGEQVNVPKEAIDEYLMEEIHGTNPEDLF